MIMQKLKLLLTLTAIMFAFFSSNILHADNICLQQFAKENGAEDPNFQQATLKPIHHEFSEKVFSYDPEKISDFHISKENFSKFPLFHLLVKQQQHHLQSQKNYQLLKFHRIERQDLACLMSQV